MRIWLLLLALLAPVGTAAHLPLSGTPPGQVELYELAPAPAVPAIMARAAILLDLDSGTTLYARDAQGRFPPASLTKVVTVLTALDELGRGRVRALRPSNNRLPGDSPRIGLRAGERLPVRELMYG